MTNKIIAASILSANFATLGEDTQAVLDAGAERIHFDVMDHHFVPNLSFGALVCKALREYGIDAPIDAHLMVDDPQPYIEAFAKAGATLISFHPETAKDVGAMIDTIKSADLKVGLTFNPDKPVEIDDDVLQRVDKILLMSVYPGFGGQSFIPECLDKIQSTRMLLDEKKCDAFLGVDGGIKVDNIGEIAAAGADYLVVGSGLFNADNYRDRVSELKNAMR